MRDFDQSEKDLLGQRPGVANIIRIGHLAMVAWVVVSITVRFTTMRLMATTIRVAVVVTIVTAAIIVVAPVATIRVRTPVARLRAAIMAVVTT